MNSPLLLRRRNWERRSADNISKFSLQNIQTYQTGDELPEDTPLVFRWGCTANVPTRNVVNTAKAIHWASDKRTSRMLIAEAGLAPKTWGSFDDWKVSWQDYEKGTHPCVVRRSDHHRGRFFDYCTDNDDVMDACAQYGEGNYYISEYIPKDREYRILVCQGRILAVNEKIPMNKALHAWGLAKNWINIRWGDWPLRAVRAAREAFLMSGLDFGAVDIIHHEGNYYVLEINTAPELPGEYQAQCTAKAFDYIVENGKAPIPVTEEKGGYLKFIHPALTEKAILVE